MAQQPSPPLLPGLGDYRRPINTTDEAQRYFDQGLALVYGFNHDEALRAFEAAARLDSTAPMIQLGLALAVAPSVDRGRNAARDRVAREALAKAQRHIGRARPEDADLIRAYAVRYADSTRTGLQLDSAYALSMRDLAARRPADAEALTLYGESLMLLARRRYWQHHDGTPAPGTPELLAAFERVMARTPTHLGANHYYIHALEMSPTPERALTAADRLQHLAPGAGHLVHMSGHVYFRLNRWADAVRANERARAADTTLFRLSPPAPTGVYPSGYHLHTLHFLWLSHAMAGQRTGAMETARALSARAAAGANAGLYAQTWYMAPLFVHLRFEEWDSILGQPAPPDNQLFSRAVWLYATGTAHAVRGNTAAATSIAAALDTAASAMPNGNVAPTAPARPLIESAARALRARLLMPANRAEAIRLLERNVAVEDSLGLMEPPPWYQSAREALAAARGGS